MVRYLFLALFIVNCGPQKAPVYKYSSSCISNISSELQLSQKLLNQNVDNAKLVLLEGGVFKDEVDLCTQIGSVPIHYRAEFNWDCNDAGCLEGHYDYTTGIELGQRGAAMVHEYLHVVDTFSFHILSYKHTGWKENGYWDMDMHFRPASVNATTVFLQDVSVQSYEQHDTQYPPIN